LAALLLLCVGATQAQTSAAGGSVAVSKGALTYTTNNVLPPILESQINGIEIPEIKINKDGFEIHMMIAARTYDFSCDDCVSGEFDAGGGTGPEGESGVKFSIEDFTLKLHWRFGWKKSIISGSGICESKIYVNAIQAKMHLGEASGRLAPMPSGKIEADIDKFDLNCDGVSGAVLNLLQEGFKDHITSALETSIQTGVLMAEEAVGGALANITLDVPITDGFAELRFDLVSQPNVSSDSVTATLLADVVPSNGSTGPGTPFPAPQTIPAYDPTVGGFFQIYLSDYSLNTAVYTYWGNGRLANIVDPAHAPPGLQPALNTSSTTLSTIAPGLTSKYPNLPVQLGLDADPKIGPYVTVSKAQKVHATITMRVAVMPVTSSGPVTAFTLQCPMQWTAQLGLSTNGSALVLNANATLDISQVTTGTSTVGSIDTKSATAFVNQITSVLVVPMINQELGTGFTLPSIPGFQPKNTQLTLTDEFVRISLDATYTPPPPPPDPSRRRRRRKLRKSGDNPKS
jgi:hypothetical protein